MKLAGLSRASRFLTEKRLRFVAAALVLICCGAVAANEPRPNVILIMTDDQGIGDLGVMGNPVIKTPEIDAIAEQSAWATKFYVHPVCTPTRACLMTGRYNYRTRAIDTYMGRAMMEPDEVTIAEVLRDAGYQTGIFGKWHLGDCYPMRAIDQGFQQAVVHRGGGIGQPSDPIEAHGQYTDPILFRNGNAEHFEGYCTDVYYDEAIKFIEQSISSDRPFFVYLPDNCPHGPFNDVPQKLFEYYNSVSLTAGEFPQTKGHPIPEKQNQDQIARIYAMINNIDQNIGRLMDKLEEMNAARNTIVIYMHDNGPNTQRYVNGLRGKKASVYEGGIRSPLFMRWPGRIRAGHRVDQIAAHIDLMPTILSMCSVAPPANVKFDGRDLSPLLTENLVDWPDRHLVIQTHRGDRPTPLHHCCVRNQRWKLVHASGFGREQFDGQPRLELYDMKEDPFETKDVADANPDVVTRLRSIYDNWFNDVSNTRPNNYAPPRIIFGDQEAPVQVLTRQDWRRISSSRSAPAGRWLVSVKNSCVCEFECHLPRKQTGDRVELSVGDQTYKQSTDASQSKARFKKIQLQTGDYEISAVAIGADRKGEPEPQSVYQIRVLCEKSD